MAVTLNASASAGLITTADTSTILQLQTGGTTALAVSAAQVVTLTNPLPVASGGSGGTTSTGSGANVLGTTPSFTSTIGVGGATASASGAGITFPAAISASSDVNTLDDYEEGTWTPNQGSGLTLVGAFSSAGYYTKVGNIVTINGYVKGATSVLCAASGIICTNAPFAGAVAGIFWTGSVISWSADSGASCAIQQDSANIYNGTAVAASDRISFSITYRAA